MPTALRPAVLHVTAARGGGVDRHIRDLAAATPRGHFVLHVGGDVDVLEDVARGQFAPLRDVSRNAPDAAALATWLRHAGVGIVHLHSVGANACRRRAAIGAGAFPYLVSLHDLTFVDPRAFDVAGIPDPDPAWIAELAGTLAGAAAIIAPSAFIRDQAARVFPGLATVTIAEGVPPPPPGPSPAVPADFSAHAPAHVIAVVGAVGPHKGSNVVEALARSLDGTDAAIVVIGYTDRTLVRGWQVPYRCYVHGPYLDRELAGWLAAYRAEIALFPNRMPESFSYTLSEVWAAGVPVVVPDCGALGERVARHGGGFRLPAGFGVAEAKALLLRLLSPAGAAELAAVKSQLAAPDSLRVPTIETMARETDALYERFALPPAAQVEAAGLPSLTPLLAANLDGFEFRKELVRLAGEVADLRASSGVARIAELEREVAAARAWAERAEAGLSDAQAWARKLESDVAAVNAELARVTQENRVLADQKAALDELPAPLRRFLLRKALHARR